MDIDKIRHEEFPVVKNLIYLNHAGVSPIPSRAATKGMAQIKEYRDFGAYNLEGWIEVSERARGLSPG
ncbi:MAG: hypothetical protein ABID54_07615 [Pseudomonadota bacterium]